MADIFISYKSQERENAKTLASALEAKGFTVWWDRDLATGDNYRKVIEKELNSARVVIVIWSTSSVASQWVLDEADLASTNRKILPVKFDPNFQDIPIGFRSIQVQDLSAWSGSSDSDEIIEIEKKVDSIANDRFQEILRRVGGNASKGNIKSSEALEFVAHLNTSVGGMPIPRFLAGSLGLSIIFAVIKGIGITMTGGQALNVLFSLPILWIILMIVRGSHQFLRLSKGKSARHFFDPSFSFAIIVSVQIALIIYAISVGLGEPFSINSLLFYVPDASILILAAIVISRAMWTGFLFLVRRAR
ncbi:MAG: toll/interleukin-1 receptor domain-containing protein [Pseudomonadota bacterium]